MKNEKTFETIQTTNLSHVTGGEHPPNITACELQAAGEAFATPETWCGSNINRNGRGSRTPR